MAKSIPIGQMLYKYYIEDDQIKVIEGVLDTRAGKKWIIFDSKTVPDEHFPGYKNVGRVWKGGEILWLTERDDTEAKRLFTAYHVEVIKDLQKQIDDAGDRISMIRKCKIAYGSSPGRRSKCFGEVGTDNVVVTKPEYERTYREGWDCSEFVNASQYSQRKIDMLKQEMFIDLSDEDVKHIKSLSSRGAIDAAVRGMINKYWPE